MNRDPDSNTAPILKGAEPIELSGPGSSAVLLLHGFGDTPQTLSLLARRLQRAGYSVSVPLLPGHGRTMDAFKASNADQWLDAARNALSDLRTRHAAVLIAGLSMGGALATILAAEHPDVPAVALIAPYLGMPRLLRAAAATHRLWGRLAG